MKRIFDLTFSFLGLVILSPLLLLVSAAIPLDSRGPVFYRGVRVGRGGKRFRVLKFRTMVPDAARRGGGLTLRADPRITRLGRFLRRTKIDELPQLFNVIRGEMSLVGPRPEDPRYVQMYTDRQRQVLSVPPGITSVASLRYRQEEDLLSGGNWEEVYTGTVLPAKLDLELSYLARRSFAFDLWIIAGTLLALVRDQAGPAGWTALLDRLESGAARYVSWGIVDAVTVVAAFFLAILVRSIDTKVNLAPALVISLGGAAFYLGANYLFGVYQRAWRFASGQESVVLFGAVLTATSAFFLVALLMPTRDLPLGAIVYGGIFAFLLMAGLRYRRQLLNGLRDALGSLAGLSAGEGARVLIMGAGEEGQLLAWQLQNRLPGKAYQVIGFVDSDPGKHGLRIHNLPVFGDRNLIPEIVERLAVDIIIIAIPYNKILQPRELLELCRETKAQVKIMPNVFDWLGQNGHEPAWVDVNEEELLRREPYRVDRKACSELLAGRVVMVTGAAGSIGSELCRQISSFLPARLVLLDIDESGLHDLRVELLAKIPDLGLQIALCDITDGHGLELLFEQTKPQIVFHVAAYKHVPILEEQPREGIRVNVLGTRLIHSLSQRFAVERFIFISSDKAVNPSNVLGLTKRIGELIVTAPPSDAKSAGGGAMLSTAVRFGNVLGSRGSVIPTFEKQIQLGGPITVTHPEMTRYFLSIAEAVSLIIQAVAMTRGSDIYILDMGVPVKIVDLANRLVRLRGLRPGVDVPIRFTGVRPGEKMCEELVAIGEEKIATEHPSIFGIRQTIPPDMRQFEAMLDDLIALSANGAGPESMRTALRELMQTLHPSSNNLPVSNPELAVGEGL